MKLPTFKNWSSKEYDVIAGRYNEELEALERKEHIVIKSLWWLERKGFKHYIPRVEANGLYVEIFIKLKASHEELGTEQELFFKSGLFSSCTYEDNQKIELGVKYENY